MYKGIIFDMDGVLLETEQYHLEAWRQVFSHYDVSLTLEQYQDKCQSQGREQAIKNILGTVSASTIDQISMQKKEAYEQIINTQGVTLFKDAQRLLERLKKQDIKLAIASSSKSARMVIEKTQYAHMFMHIVTGADVAKNKPSPQIFQKAQHLLGLDPKEVVVIEDSIVGIYGALDAQMDVIGINRHDSLASLDKQIQENEGRLKVIQSLDEIFNS